MKTDFLRSRLRWDMTQIYLDPNMTIVDKTTKHALMWIFTATLVTARVTNEL